MTVIGHGYDDNVGAPAFRNLIINGSMSVAQRNTSVASISTGNYYTADRWNFAQSSTAVWTQSVENDAPTGSGFRKSLKMLNTTADSAVANTDLVIVEQRLEGQNLQHFAKGTSLAKPFALQFWVKSNVTGTYAIDLYDSTNARNVSANYTIVSSGTWEKKTVVFPADTAGVLNNDSGVGLYLRFWLMAGSTYSASPLQTVWGTGANIATGQVNVAAAVNNYWQITGVQLEAGPVATPFEFLPFGDELRRCQRYYQSGSTPDLYMTFYNPVGDAVYRGVMYPIPHKVTMRSNPNVSITTTSIDNFVCYANDANTTLLNLRFRANSTGAPYGSGSVTFTLSSEL